jgi:ketosteroid isomerase-like protein
MGAWRMEKESLKSWLDSYGQAWMGRDPNAAVALYTDDATYQVTPFDEALRGRAAIYRYWVGVAKTQERIHFDYEVIAVTAEKGVARWWASFVIMPPGLETKLDGIFLVSLNSDGRCQSLREWWHKLQ